MPLPIPVEFTELIQEPFNLLCLYVVSMEHEVNLLAQHIYIEQRKFTS